MFKIFTKKNISATDSAAIVEIIKRSQKLESADMAAALHLVDSALILSKEAHFSYGIGNAYITYAVYAMTSGDFAKSDSFFNLAYPYCVQASKFSQTNNLIVLWYKNKGTHSAYIGDYDQAVSCSFKALNLLSQKAADSTFVSLKIKLYNDIGSMLQYVDRPDKAIYYLQAGADLAKVKNQNNQLASLYVNFGNAYRQKEDEEIGRGYFQRAIRIALHENDYFVLLTAYLSMANSFIAQNKTPEAIFWLKKAKDIRGNFNPYMSKAIPGITLGNIYLERNEYKKAIENGKEALERGESLGTVQIISLSHKLLAKAYSAIGQWEQAFYHQYSFNLINDSLQDVQKMQDINQLEIKFQTAIKDKKLAEQRVSLIRQKDALREKNLWIWGIALTGFLLLTLLMFIRQNYRNRQKFLIGQMEVSRMEAVMDGEEQERKRIARELHDGIMSQLLAVKLGLSGALKRAEYKTLERDDFQQSLDHLSEAMQDLRTTAQNMTSENLLSAGFRNAVESFCEKMNNSGAVSVIFQAYGEIPVLNNVFLLSLYRIIQELIQNALKHADANTILVQLNYRKAILGITVQDDGHGFLSEDTSVSGSGLQHIDERVQSLKGTFEISTDRTGTSIYLEFLNLK